jgi:hypothetical protein
MSRLERAADEPARHKDQSPQSPFSGLSPIAAGLNALKMGGVAGDHCVEATEAIMVKKKGPHKPSSFRNTQSTSGQLCSIRV